jgi:SSS family solute:Na+ symporter
MSHLDYAILAAYLGVVATIGFVCGRGQHSLNAFFLGSREVPWWAAACSGVASIVSGAAYLGGPGFAFSKDYTYHQMRFGIPIALLVICGVMLPIFFRLNIFSIYEYLEKRFSRRVRLLASAIFLLSKCGYLVIVLYAPSIVIAQATGFPLRFIILGVGIGTSIYTLYGGMKAVVWTDTLQVTILISGVVLALWIVLHKTPGGLNGVVHTASAAGRLRLFNWSPSFRETYTFWGGVFGGAVIVISQFGSNQGEIQRFLSTKSIREANRALITALLLSVAVGIALFFVGTALFGYYSAFPAKGGLSVDPNRIFAKFILEEMPTGVRGLLVATVLAASMSTLSAMLNSLATVTTVDFAPLWRKRASTVREARLTTLFFGLAITLAACFGGGIGNLIDASAHVISLFMGGLTGVFLLGMLSRKATASSAFWGLIAGTAAAIIADRCASISFLWLSPIAAGVSYFSAIGISALTKPDLSEASAALTWRSARTDRN